jgi:hypothetical protein
MRVNKTTYPRWNNHPVYECKLEDYNEVKNWMYQNNCDPFLLSSGAHGYIFQVRNNHLWFVLRWS